MEKLLDKFNKNSLRIGLFVNDAGSKYFFGSVGRKHKGEIFWNGFLEWDDRTDYTGHVTRHNDRYEHFKASGNYKFPILRPKNDKGTLPNQIISTSVHKDTAKLIGVHPPNGIFTHEFIVSNEELGTIESANTTIIEIELVPIGEVSSISTNQHAEILQQEIFNEDISKTELGNVIITHVRRHE